MTAEGSLMSSVFVEDTTLTETTLAAISSSVWSNYYQGICAFQIILYFFFFFFFFQVVTMFPSS